MSPPAVDAHGSIRVVATDARADVSTALADAGVSPLDASARGPVQCAFEGPVRVLGAMPITRMRISAHGDEAMLVAEYTSSFAPEPAGDSVDTHAARWWRFRTASATTDSPARGHIDPLDAPSSAEGANDPSVCEHARWGEDAERAVWESDHWTRWRHASAWGGPSCAPCGTYRARVGAPNVGSQTNRAVTDVMSEFEVSSVEGFTFGATLLERFDYSGPTDLERNECSEVALVIETMVATATGFERHELRRTRRSERGEVAYRLATAATNVGGLDGVIVTTHGDEQTRIEARRVDSRGQLLGTARVVHSAADIGSFGVGYLGATLALVWSEGAARVPIARNVIRWTTFDPRGSERPVVRTLRAPAGHTIGDLSMASDGATMALLWVESPTRGPSVVRVAAATSIDELGRIVERGGIAAQTTRESIQATSVAVAGDWVWVVTSDPAAHGDARPRVRTLRCQPVDAQSAAP